MRNFEITKREVLASISIIAVMILVGILISAKITERQMDRNEVYNKAVKIDNQEMFSYGMRTNVGSAFVYGTLRWRWMHQMRVMRLCTLMTSRSILLGRISKMKAKRALCMLAAILLVVAMMLMFLTGCNRQVIDTTFSYDNAILALPDGSVISGKIESWKDYDDGDQIQVKIDGTTYLVHSVNIVLIKE